MSTDKIFSTEMPWSLNHVDYVNEFKQSSTSSKMLIDFVFRRNVSEVRTYEIRPIPVQGIIKLQVFRYEYSLNINVDIIYQLHLNLVDFHNTSIVCVSTYLPNDVLLE